MVQSNGFKIKTEQPLQYYEEPFRSVHFKIEAVEYFLSQIQKLSIVSEEELRYLTTFWKRGKV